MQLLLKFPPKKKSMNSGGSKRGVRDAPPGPNSFNLMQLLGKFGKVVCWRPARPSTDEVKKISIYTNPPPDPRFYQVKNPCGAK